MNLSDITKSIRILEITGNPLVGISGLEFDSRKVENGFAFIAQRGLHVDGHNYISAAIEKGASAIFCEEIPAATENHVTYIKVENTSLITGEIASAFYGFPSHNLKVIGVTGTNGKTSIATLLYRLFRQLGYKSGLISTITYEIDGKTENASYTTPDGLKIQQLMHSMAKAGCEFCFMEVSTHAIHQQRINGIRFTGGIFTNLTHDHLDYHITFADYLKAKKRFFDLLPVTAFALTNIDDRNGMVMVQNTAAKIYTFSMQAMANFRCKVIESHFDGMLLNIEGSETWTHFVGKFNASNLLAIYSTAICLNQNPSDVLRILSELRPVEGRFDTIRSADGKLAIVDYAHTPDALKNVLKTISEIRNNNEQLITVVGAGGDRDKTKRPKMAHEALNASDKVILTSDNPRTENPADIIRDMEAGVETRFRNKVLSIENRREAIKTAAMLSKPGDIILIAGKGHEKYQEINGVKYHFDDKEEIKKCFGIDD